MPVDDAAAVKSASGTASQVSARALMQQVQEAFLGIEDRNRRRERIESSWREAAVATETNGCRVLTVRLHDRIVSWGDTISMSIVSRWGIQEMAMDTSIAYAYSD